MCMSCLRQFAGFALPLTLACAPVAALATDPPVEIPLDKPIFTVTYGCDSGQTIVVRYDNSNAEKPTARLEYKDRTFKLYNVISGSGARYATEQGLAPDKGLQWWTKGDGATLSEMLMDHTAPEPTLIETCRAKSAE
ncbi:MliC family protein [Rhizobiaceae bacterium n13]|uniref:MliC family protein n=1 Tax=Ferirhizobium litorale TaxID=2927786 RepID=A0AAE3U1V7_9HYPH|nr:MliC family protein [Fererhizobium litorale]MDI7861611.1 MliC family protein [Fererhizobium litorale]MDI7922047.1 MliC family protein [Fererhizobium litorale]